MKTFLSSTPVLLFLVLFNAVVAVLAHLALDGARGTATSVGMGVVSLGALVALLTRGRRRSRAVRR